MQEENPLLEELHAVKNLQEKLYRLVVILRNHCEWDKKQTLGSLKTSLLEETYEVIQGIDEKDPGKQKSILLEELGDLLFLVYFHIRLCEEKGYFTLEDIYRHTIEKFVSKHPHVFGNTVLNNARDVLKQWEDLKKKEFGENTEFLPALLRAEKIQKRASLEGFDWIEKTGSQHLLEILAKIEEEIQELRQEILQGERDRIEEETGDLLFSVVNLARHLHITAELALHKSIEKFIRRFRTVLETLANQVAEPLSGEEKQKKLEEIYTSIKSKEKHENRN